MSGVYTIFGGVEFSGWSTMSVSRSDVSVGATIHMGLKAGSAALVGAGKKFMYPTVFIGVAEGDVEDSSTILNVIPGMKSMLRAAWAGNPSFRPEMPQICQEISAAFTQRR